MEDQYKRIFSKNLLYFMTIQGKTQTDLIRDLGVDKSTVSTWVNGTRLPRMSKIDLLAHYLGITRSDLVEDHAVHDQREPELSDLEKDIIRAFRRSSDDIRIAVCAVLGVKKGTESAKDGSIAE